MAQSILNQILNELETLDLEELQQLAWAVQRNLASKKGTARRTALHEALIASGLVKQIKQPSYRLQAERRLIQVQGKPVSETIIEERR